MPHSDFGSAYQDFLLSLHLDARLPESVVCMNPYKNPEVQRVIGEFARKYLNSAEPRIALWGINPGRHGGGITGLSFTDPLSLRSILGIEHTLGAQAELSATFVHKVIENLGGPSEFYARFYLTAVCPLGFVKSGRNYNFYDSPDLMKATDAFIRRSIKAQIDMGIRRDVTYCLGTGQIYKYLLNLNDEEEYFHSIVPLEHPRFVMQYRRPKMDEFVNRYTEALRAGIS